MALTKEQAEQLTKQLQSKTQQLAKLITKAHDGEVWVNLGYKSFAEWAKAELPFTYARAFQLLSMGVLTEQLKAVMTLPDEFTLTDTQARGIARYGRKLFIDAAKDEATNDVSQNIQIINDLISERIKSDNTRGQAAKQENTQKTISGGGSAWTHTSHVKSLQFQSIEFPHAQGLDQKTREQGITLILQAQSNINKMLDDIRDKNTKYENHQRDKN